MAAHCMPSLSRGSSGLSSCVSGPPEGPPPPAEMIKPRSGVVFKFKDKSGCKVFVNAVSHHLVQKPLDERMQEVSLEHLEKRGISNLRVPINVGQPFSVQDNAGVESLAVDVVFHPAVVVRAREGKLVEHYQRELAAILVKKLYEELIAPGKVKLGGLEAKGWKVLKGKYKGGDGPRPFPMWLMGFSLGTVEQQRGVAGDETSPVGKGSMKILPGHGDAANGEHVEKSLQAVEAEWQELAETVVAEGSFNAHPLRSPTSWKAGRDETQVLAALRRMNSSTRNPLETDHYEQALLQRGSSLRDRKADPPPRKEAQAGGYARQAPAMHPHSRRNVWVRLPGASRHEVHVNVNTSQGGTGGSFRSLNKHFSRTAQQAGAGSRGGWAELLKEVAIKMEGEARPAGPSRTNSRSSQGSRGAQVNVEASVVPVQCEKIEPRSDFVMMEQQDPDTGASSPYTRGDSGLSGCSASHSLSPSLELGDDLCPTTCDVLVHPEEQSSTQPLQLVDHDTGLERSWFAAAEARRAVSMHTLHESSHRSASRRQSQDEDWDAAASGGWRRRQHQHVSRSASLCPVQERSEEGRSEEGRSEEEGGIEGFFDTDDEDGMWSSGGSSRRSSVSLMPSDSVSLARFRSRMSVSGTHGASTPRTAMDDYEWDVLEAVALEEELANVKLAGAGSVCSALTSRTAELGYWQGEYALDSQDYIRMQDDKPWSTAC